MKNSIKILLFLAISLSVYVSVFGQVQRKLPPRTFQAYIREERISWVGLASIYYVKDEDKTGANVTISVDNSVTKPKEISNRLYFALSYEVDGKKIAEPEFIDLRVSSFSSEREKYKDNHKVGIYVDDVLLFSEEPNDKSLVHPVDMWIESFNFPKIKLTDFRKMIDAKQIKIEFGETKIQLTAEDKQGLIDLNKTMTYMD